MKKTVITAQNAPAAVGAYSHAIMAGNTLFTSGQLGLDPVSGQLKEGVEAQAVQALDNLKAVVEAAGLTMSSIVKTVIFLADIKDFAVVNEIYATYFKENPPARSCVQVAALPKGGLVEIEVVALKEE